ncbi:calmodulin-binding-domain-containing protein [Entophlyctis helioformis]|nr:calmodulin-binding-domain-containing protein [Entophlyctis helioformis]
MAEARRTHQRHMAGVAMGMLLHPSKGLRDDIARAGGTPKDHMKENRQMLRNMQKDNKHRKDEAAKQPPPPFKLKQFADVPPRVSTRSRTGSEASSEGTLSSRPSTAGLSEASRTSSKPKNFIAINAAKAKKPSSSISSSKTVTPTEDPKSRIKPGQIPKYLVDRKLQWARQEEERIMALEKDKIPAGMALLPDIERVRTLNGLRRQHQELLDELSRFPMIVELPSLKARRARIERDLTEVEQAIDTFSKPKVFVPADALAQLYDGR